ncbi:GtrA family protein [Pedobacter rhizosphaerae]|uniref:Putative flippase GtrA (Transmembrane translocase of bactoprenol-linked glucose) n=1 Tax=Pedobacter rhizosphaerae TaxID=390241 RepID=A0A1H9VIA4_9SPHI|nr:GtrA family protein [Pedobacter rhizosphaerae]SES20977.1 Putative flippase GtrA (transmembrane translocase of bactoprenol-linked glucose) [Pedobacter rhizosphaerae]
MFTYLKAQASSISASMLDFLITIIGARFFGWWYLAASIAGTVSGGILNFYINRTWVFGATSKNIKWQAVKYIMVWLGNLLLVTLGVYILTHFFHLNYVLSKVLVSLVLGTTYNYIMQKQFIFTR